MPNHSCSRVSPRATQKSNTYCQATIGGNEGGGGVFLQTQRVRIQMNDEVQTPEITITWTLQATGDALTGTLLRALPNAPEPQAPSPVTGTRVKS